MRNRQHTKGFTLIEMMVSVAIFSIVMLVALGTILTVLDANRKAQTLSSVMGNLNLALESMTRTIKTGSSPSRLASNCNSILQVTDADGFVTLYKKENNSITKKVDSASAVAITAPEVVVECFNATVTNNTPNNQPLTVLQVKGYAQITPRIKSNFVVQTSVSQRDLNCGASGCFE